MGDTQDAWTAASHVGPLGDVEGLGREWTLSHVSCFSAVVLLCQLLPVTLREKDSKKKIAKSLQEESFLYSLCA